MLPRDLLVRSRRLMRTLGPVLTLFCGVICLAASSSSAFAQTISLTDAFDRMLDREVQYEILDLEQNIAEELVRQARGERYPRVGLNIQYIQTRQEIINQDNTTFQDGLSEYPTTRVTLSARQPLYDRVLWRALPLAEAEQKLVSGQAVVARNQLTTMLIGAYLDVARAQLGVEQARIMVLARSQLASGLALMVDAGTIGADSYLRAQSDVFEARALLSEREFDQTTALFELYRFTGSDVSAVSYAGASVGIPNYNSLVDTFNNDLLREVSPAIQVALAEFDVSQRQQEIAKASFQPTADMTLDYSYEETEGSLFGGGSTVQSVDLGLNAELLIYEGGIRRSRLREADFRVQMADLRVQQTAELSDSRYEALTAALQRSLQSVNAISAERGAARRRLTAANEQQDAGRIGPEAALEARLRSDTLGLQVQIARLRVIQIQAELLALFGALDVQALSQDFSGT